MPSHTANDPRRTHPRHAAQNLQCALGEVCDLSASGMRLRCKGKPPLAVGQSGSFKLTFADGALALTGQAMWTRKVARRTFEVGIRFTRLTPAHEKAIDSIARFGFLDVNCDHTSGRRDRNSRSRRQAKIRATFAVPDYYRLLGVEPDASRDDIKRAFHGLAKTCHPDVTSDPNAAETFATISAAYEVLRDPERRAMYDLRSAA